MTKDDFLKAVNRHKTLQEYVQAFRLCLDSLSNADLADTASETARELIANFSYNVMAEGKNYYLSDLPLEIDVNWIVDTAIAQGYQTLEKDKLSTGIFSSVPCVTIGNMLTRQKFAVGDVKKSSDKIFYYSKSGFSTDFKLIKALLNDIVDKLNVKYNEFARIKGYLPSFDD